MRISHVGNWIRRGVVGGCLLVLLFVAVSVHRLRSALERTADVPLSPLTACGRVSPAYLDRHDVTTTESVRGLLEDFEALAHPGFDPDTVHPSVRRFYERTSELTVCYSVIWHSGFRLGAALASLLTSAIEQLNLPGPCDSSRRQLQTHLVGIESETDPRRDARAWIRTDAETDEVVFVALYGTHRQNDVTYVNIAAPLPWANLSTVLSVDTIPTDGDYDGLELTTTTAIGDEGLYLVTPIGTVPLPLDQTFRVYPADVRGRPSAGVGNDDAITATHDMWVWGRKFLTIEYTARQTTNP